MRAQPAVPSRRRAAGRADALEQRRSRRCPPRRGTGDRGRTRRQLDVASLSMQVAVIGAGVIGVTTAYELATDGHEVTVFDRCGTVAAGCSFANAGLVAPGYVAPWAAPGMPAKVLRHLFAEHAPVRIAGRLDAAALGWTWRWWRSCRPEVYRANRARMHRLAHYSRERLLQMA